MRSFGEIMAIAELHKGGASAVGALLPEVKTEAALKAVSDDRYLSEMSRRIFRAGLKHSVVDARWPAFEKAFWHFDPAKLELLSDEQLERLAADKTIIRHLGKIRAVRTNAMMVRQISREAGSVGVFLAEWPADNIVGLWGYLKKHGAQLGGDSAARFLRMVGKDTFILTNDVVAALVYDQVVDKKPSSQKALAQVQEAFNSWQQETGLPLAHLSRILSMTVFS